MAPATDPEPAQDPAEPSQLPAPLTGGAAEAGGSEAPTAEAPEGPLVSEDDGPADDDGAAEADAGSDVPLPPALATPDRLAEMLERLDAEVAPTEEPGRATDNLAETLLREARLGVASASTALAEAELELQRLQQEATALARTIRAYPQRVVRGEYSVGQATEEIARLASEQKRYDELYETLSQDRLAAQERAAGFADLAARAEARLASRLSDPTVRNALAKVRERAQLAARLADVLSRGVALSAANAEAASEAIAAIQHVVATAAERALLYRSPERVYHRPPDQALYDLRQLIPAAFGRPGPGSYVLAYWLPWTLGIVALAAGLDWLLGLAIVAFARRRPGRSPSTGAEIALLIARRLAAVAAVRAVCEAFALQAATGRFYATAALLSLAALTLHDLFHRYPVPDDCPDRDARLWTRRWLQGIAAVTALCLPLILTLRALGYPAELAVAQIEAVLGTALATMVTVWLWPAGTLAAVGGWPVPYWQAIVQREGATRPVAIALAISVTAAHWLGWMNLARALATALSLSFVTILLALTLDEWIKSGYGARGDEERPARSPLMSAAIILVWMAAACAVAWAWGLRVYHIDRALAWLSSPVLSVQGVRVSAFSLARGVAVAVVVILIGRLLRGWIERQTFGGRISEGARFAAATLTYYLLVAGGILGGVLAAGLGLSVLTVFASVAGVAIGFGSQDIARNFISGLIILLDRSINVGDFVTIGTAEGTIVEINIRCTTLRTPDNLRVIVPNSNLVGQQMVSANQLDRRLRVSLDVQVDPQADPDQVTEILQIAARSHPAVLGDPPPEVWMSRLAAASLSFQLQMWTDRIEARQEVMNQVLTTIWRELKARGIDLV